MKDNSSLFSIKVMCKVLNVSRSGYYDWFSRPPSKRAKENNRLLKRIKKIHDENRRTYGYRRIHAELKVQQMNTGPNRVARIMKCHGIRPKTIKKYRITTDSKHSYPIQTNVLNRQFNPPAVNQVWSGDITFIPTLEGWLFLAVILDLFSRRVVGWAMGHRITAELVKKALVMAIRHRNLSIGTDLLWHSDQGIQYASIEYQRILKDYQITGSMSRRGNCWDNAVVESFFHSLKTELIHHETYTTREDAEKSIFEYIECFYNPKRRHSTLGYLSPNEYESILMVA